MKVLTEFSDHFTIDPFLATFRDDTHIICLSLMVRSLRYTPPPLDLGCSFPVRMTYYDGPGVGRFRGVVVRLTYYDGLGVGRFRGVVVRLTY